MGITVTRGTANCAAPPSSGFCADTSSGSVNVFATASNAQVWRFSNTTAKNLEAQCYYNSLLDGSCSISTQVCRNYLKTLACLTVFPQCDASGYQMPVCMIFALVWLLPVVMIKVFSITWVVVLIASL